MNYNQINHSVLRNGTRGVDGTVILILIFGKKKSPLSFPFSLMGMDQIERCLASLEAEPEESGAGAPH